MGRIKTGLVISVRVIRKGARWAMASLEAAVLFGCAFRISIPTALGMSHSGGAINRSMIHKRPWRIAKRSSHGFAGNTVETPGEWCSVGFPEALLPVIILACTMTKSPNCGGLLFPTATTMGPVNGSIRAQTEPLPCNDYVGSGPDLSSCVQRGASSRRRPST